MRGLRALRVRWLLMALGAALAVTACGGGDAGPSGPRATFEGLGPLPGYAASEAAAVSPEGMVVVGTSTNAEGVRQAFRWTAAQGAIGLGFMPGGTFSMATAVAGNGEVVIGVGDVSNIVPARSAAVFRWTPDAGLQRLETLPGASLCSAGGVSRDGRVVVGTCLQINDTAFRWTPDTGAVALDRFGTGSNLQSSATAVSLDGAVTVGAGHPALTGAVAWPTAGVPIVLGKLPGDVEAIATAASRDGTVVVGSSLDSASHSRGFRWTAASGMLGLVSSDADFRGNVVTSASGDGDVIVGWGSAGAEDVALIWDKEHGLRELTAVLSADYRTEIPGWKLTRATGVSEDGRTIVGSGINPQGATQAWIVRLPGT